MQRRRHDEFRVLPHIRLPAATVAQQVSQRPHAVVLQQVNDLAQFPHIGPVGPDAVQGLRLTAANAADALAVESGLMQYLALAQCATQGVVPTLDSA